MIPPILNDSLSSLSEPSLPIAWIGTGLVWVCTASILT